MTTVDPARLRRLGCGLGSAGSSGQERPDALVVLAFGMPEHHRGRFGASLFGRFANSKKIGRAAVAYGRGFVRGLGGGFGHLTLSVGTSNFGRGVTYRHGRIWASMINRSNRTLQGLGIGNLVQVVGGNDIEPGWRGPVATRQWIEGYHSLTDTPYYNFGGAAGCPPIGRCQGNWTLEDIWYAAWGSGIAVPLPEIYTKTGSNASSGITWRCTRSWRTDAGWRSPARCRSCSRAGTTTTAAGASATRRGNPGRSCGAR
jgi:hypothetical protein